MSMPYSALFAPLQVGRVELRNRIVAPPMVQVRDITSKEGVAWYRRLANGGAGLVIVEATGVPRFGDDLTVDTLRPLTKAIHKEGAAAAIQLFPLHFGTQRDLMALTAADLEDICRQYATAAVICRDAGFDAVEPHGAHGYLLNQFFMPEVNKRTDEYGGSLEKRCKLAVDIVESIRQAVGEDLLILYRHTPIGKEYWLNDSLVLAHHLLDAGVNVLDISPARDKAVADLAGPFKARFQDVPVIAVRGMEDPAAAAAALRDGRCDLVAVGRSLICDAKWPAKVRENKLDTIVQCVKCDKGCFGRLRAREPVFCERWTKDEVAGFVE